MRSLTSLFILILKFVGLITLAPSSALAQTENDPEFRPRILIYSDAHRDMPRIIRMMHIARSLDIDYVMGGGDLQEGRSLTEVANIYRFVARQLTWLRDPPYEENLGRYRQSSRWIEMMGNKEEYGFLRLDRRNFGREARRIIGEVAIVPDAKPDEGQVFNFNGFKIYMSHMPVSPVPPELTANHSARNLRNILWPPNWPLPGFSGPEPSTRSATSKNIHPADVNLVVYHHLHVAADYLDPVTGIHVVSPGSASRNKSVPDQMTASFMIVDTRTHKVSWHDISDGGRKYFELHLEDTSIFSRPSCAGFARRVSRQTSAAPSSVAPRPHSSISRSLRR